MLQEIVRVNGAPRPVSDQDQVARVFYPVAQFATRKEFAYRVSVVDSSEANAYALPDGRVIVFTGLLARLRKDDVAPLAFVCAHEISHVALQHADRKMRAGLTSATIIVVLGRVLRVKGDLAALAAGVAQSLLTSGYSRKMEAEADRGGFNLARRAGFDPNGRPRRWRPTS